MLLLHLTSTQRAEPRAHKEVPDCEEEDGLGEEACVIVEVPSLKPAASKEACLGTRAGPTAC